MFKLVTTWLHGANDTATRRRRESLTKLQDQCLPQDQTPKGFCAGLETGSHWTVFSLSFLPFFSPLQPPPTPIPNPISILKQGLTKLPKLVVNSFCSPDQS